MYRLRRLYLDSCGVPENRFTDLLVDFTDTAGEPTDTIVWLRNGAGKTTMLSLLLALILPDRRDFLAHRTKNRTLEDLIGATDTAHVAAEWVSPEGHLLLTGAVYEWDSRVKPHDYNGKGKDRLRRSWWCLTPDPGVEAATLDTLPFTLRSRGTYDRERFCAHISALPARGVNAVVASQSIGEWHAALRERRFDPDLFRYFTEVNAAEGGLEGLFSGIDSPGAFVRYLLKFVGDHKRVTPVRDLLSDTAAEIAKQPIYEAERTFCQQARPHIAALGGARREMGEAATQRAETHTRAAEFKRALNDRAAVAAARLTLAHEVEKDADDALKSIRSAIDSARARAAEYIKIAARFRRDAAKSHWQDAQNHVQRTELDTQSWAAVEHHHQLAVRKAELDARREALQAASEQARPLVDNLHAAQARLAGALDNEINKSRAAIEDLGEQVEATVDEQRAADSQWRQAQTRLGELDGEEQTLRARIADFDAARQRLIGDGILSEDETLRAAHTRVHGEHQVAESAERRLRHERELVKQAATATSEQLDRDRAAAEATADMHRGLTAELTLLTTRANDLADNARLRALLQTEAVDLEHSAHDAIAALESAEATADAELISLKERIAGHERAIHALRGTGLLPPRLDVQNVVDQLNAAGITARPGWHYLAEHVIDTAERLRRIAEHPAVADGVIIYEDPAAIGQLDTAVDGLVVVSPATAFAEPGNALTVFGPTAAQHDKTAAALELETRHARYDTDQQRHGAFARQRNDDAALRSALVAFENDLPADGLAGLRVREAQAAADLSAKRHTEAQTAADLKELRSRIENLGTDIETARDTAAKLATWLPQLARLVHDQEDVINPAGRRLGAIPGERLELKHRSDQADTRSRTAADRIAELKVELGETSRKQRSWESRRAPLAAAVATDQPLEAVEAAARAAEDQLREDYPEAALRLAVKTAEHEVSAAAKAWNNHTEPARRRAIELAATYAAADRDSRDQAAKRAAAHHAQANRALGEARTELEGAEREYKEADERRRSGRPAADIQEVASREEAQSLAAQAEHDVSAGETQRNTYTDTRDLARADAATAQAQIQTLQAQAASLRRIEAAETTAVMLPDDPELIQAATENVVADIDAADELCDRTVQEFTDRADTLTRWASRDEFAKLAEDEHGQAVRQLRDMFREKPQLDHVANNAEHLAHELEIRENAITQQLTQVEAHKANVVARMGDLVLDALGVISRASTLSELPAGVGPWEHKNFLLVEPRNRPTREQIALRVGDLIDRMVAGRRIEIDPAELLWQATEAAVPEGFRATVLKPAPEQPTGRIPVEHMQKWSGGENLTASLVLFCVLARLRAEQRTGTKSGAVGGVLPLDNPLGKANYVPFLELQRKVAHANGVQLVFWTGIGDLGAVTRFPRIAAMHKRPSDNRPGRAYVQMDQENSQVLDLVSAVRREP
jgi:hypothetical protein